MKNTGLKGATDAMAYCKSMGDKNPKNLIMRKMSSYAMGGSTEDCTSDPGKPKRCRKSSKSRSSGKTQSWFGPNLPGT
jgi:hypothetical protein